MSRAREFADLASSVDAGGITGKNLIINGAMQVAQRGTSFSSITGSTYTLDRFAVRDATAVSQSTDVPSGAGFKNSLFYDNAGTRGSINIRQVIEDATRLLNDTPCTLSFWAKGSTSASCSVDLVDTNTTGFALTTDWVKYEITFPATSNLNSGDTYEAGAVWIDFNFGASYPDVYLTGIQLEVGEQATPFEHRSYGDELARCQRYFYKQQDDQIHSLDITASQTYHCTRELPVSMRTTPTVTVSINADSGFNEGTVSINGLTDEQKVAVACQSNETRARGYFQFNLTSVDAEL